jgi:hypothetical protein
MDRRPEFAFALDTTAVVLFVTIGRRNHDQEPGIGGIISTVWPFLIALLVGWALQRAWRQPMALRTGAVVWAVTWLLGMVVRRLAGDGTALSFVIVTGLFLGATIVGWRALAALITRRRSARPSESGRERRTV